MLNSNTNLKVKDGLSREREVLFEKLSTIFDPETASDFVSPKLNEARQQLSLEELRNLDYNKYEAYLQRLRSLVHYKTTTQSLSRADLEAAYQSFVRDQVAQQSPRHKLEEFVRNSSDIDAAKNYLEMANDALLNPQQSLLLFRSSKLNEEKANLLKSFGHYSSLQQVNDDPSIQKFFSEKLNDTPRRHIERENVDEDSNVHRQKQSRSQSLHIEHKEKKYHVKFLQKTNANSQAFRWNKNNRPIPIIDQSKSKQIDIFLNADGSTTQNHSPELFESNLHRETFPPLSFSALKEYRPTVTPQPPSSRITSTKTNVKQRRKQNYKNDFIWNQSVPSSTKI